MSDPDRLAGVLGVCAVTFAAAAPWSIAAAQASVIAAAAALAASRLVDRTRRADRLPLTLWCVLGFLAAEALSIPFGVHPRRSLLLLKDSWILLFPFVFWGLLRAEGVRRAALAVFAASGSLAGLYGAVQYFVGRDWVRDRALEIYGGGGFVAVGAFGGHLSYSGVLLPAFFVAAGLGLERRRWVFAAAAGIIGLGLLFGFARTAWIGLAAGILFLAGSRRRSAVLPAAVGLATVLLAAIAIAPPLRERFFSIFDLHDDPRSRLWRTALRIFADHPVFGAGLGSFKTLFPVYRVPGDYMSTIHPHSDLLNHLVEAGLVGALAWISIWVAFFRETGGRRSPLLDALRAGVVALLVAGLGQCFSTDEEPAQAWWFVAVAALWTARALPARACAARLRPVGERRVGFGRDLSRRFKRTSLPLASRLLASRAAPRSPRSEVARIVVVRQDNRLGNLLLMTPFLRRLRESLPGAHLAFLSGESYASLARTWPWVDEWIVQPKRRHASCPPLFVPWIASVRRGRWDLAFELSHHHTHSYYNCLLTLATGAPERIGFDHPLSRDALTRCVPRPDPTLHLSLAPLRLLRDIGLSAPPASMELPASAPPSDLFRRWAAREGALGPRLVLHLGGRDAKAWPLEAWEAFLPRALALAPGPVVLVAGSDEQARLDALVRGSGARVLRAPALRLEDLVHLLRGASGFVGCDSGVTHLSVALGTPTVALFFRSNPFHYAPLGPEHATALLADPYGAHGEAWQQVSEGPARSSLHAALPRDEEASRLGVPETGPRALDALEGALREVLDRAEHRSDDPAASAGRTAE